MTRTRVYISGPMTKGDRIANFAVALNAYRQLIAAGFAPMCPHLTFLVADMVPNDHAAWLAIDLPWVAAADAVLRLPGESVGADMEVAHAESLDIPVYESLESLLMTNECDA